MPTIAFIGDVMLGRGVNEELAWRLPPSVWGDILPILTEASAVVANLECAITTHLTPWLRSPKVFHFRADPAAIAALKAANVRLVSLANNHVLDFEEQGLLDTLRYLDAADIRHAGAGRTLAEAMAPAWIEVQGLRLGVIALTDNQPDFAAGAEQPGTFYAPIRLGGAFLDLISERVQLLRTKGADLIVLSLHWGPNMVATPSRRFRDFARAAVDLGVDIVHGHSAHLAQGVEFHGRGLILYDTGDFLDDYAVDPELRNDWSFVFLVEADRRGPRRLRMIPVRLGFAVVNRARGDEAAAMCRRMAALCADLGTEVGSDDEGLRLDIAG